MQDEKKIKVYVYPVAGKIQHATVVAPAGWTSSVSLCRRFMPPDEARYQGYDLGYGDEIAAKQTLWRLANAFETTLILAELDQDTLEQLLVDEEVED